MKEETIDSLSDKISNKEVTVTEVVKKYLENIEQSNDFYNIFISIEEDVMEKAHQADEEILNGEYKGKLHGIPIGIKDMLNVKGTKTTAGSLVFKNNIATDDAVLIRRLKEAGAIIMGKLNMDEFSLGIMGTNGEFGTVKNPLNPDFISGGSSSGPAAAVSKGLCVATVGSDTAGSIRIPASFCGVVGLKPSYEQLSVEGSIPLSKSLDHLGFIAKTVADLSIIYRELGISTKKTKCINTPMKVGVLPIDSLGELNANVKEAYQNVLVMLRKNKIEVKEFRIPDKHLLVQAELDITWKEAAKWHLENTSTLSDKYGGDFKWKIEHGLSISDESYQKALEMRDFWNNHLTQVLKEVDYLLMPTVPELPLPLEEIDTDTTVYARNVIKLTSIANLTGKPALTIPIKSIENDLSVGLQIMTAENCEFDLFDFAHSLEKIVKDDYIE